MRTLCVYVPVCALEQIQMQRSMSLFSSLLFILLASMSNTSVTALSFAL